MKFLRELWVGAGWPLRMFMLGLVGLVIGYPIAGAISDYQNRPRVIVTYPTLEPDTACDAQMKAAEKEMRLGSGESQLQKTGNICKTKAEWIKSLEKYPGAMGVTEAVYLDGQEIRTFCGGFPKARICKN